MRRSVVLAVTAAFAVAGSAVQPADTFKLALDIKDILTVVRTQYYNSGGMLARIRLESGLRPDQVALGLPATTTAAGGGYVSPAVVNRALDCLARGTTCGSSTLP